MTARPDAVAHETPRNESGLSDGRMHKLQSLLEVAKAMTVEKDLEALLRLVVDEAVKMVEADRASLFLVDRERGEMWSKIAQGVGQEIRLPIGQGISGFVALSGEIVNIPDAYQDPRFNRETDDKTGYRTRSMLCVPMRRTDGDVVGLLLALNKKTGPFDAQDESMLMALGSQAAAAIDNAILHEEIERLFEGFIRASVVAIESRDPSTSGHSERVATLTLGLAESLERQDNGPYARVRFTREELKELRYAALLHDFGKVGVREHVLVKAEKLYPSELEVVRTRFALIRRTLELEAERQKTALLRENYEQAMARIGQIEAQTALRLAELYDFESFVLACNRPQIVPGGTYTRLQEIAQRTFKDGNNIERPYLRWRRDRGAVDRARDRCRARSGARSRATSRTRTDFWRRSRGRASCARFRRSPTRTTRSSTAPAIRAACAATRFRCRRAS